MTLDEGNTLVSTVLKLTKTVEISMNIVESQKAEIQQMQYVIKQLQKEMQRVSGFTLNP